MITNKLKLDLQKPGTTPTINAVQNDSYSRNLEIALFSDKRPFVFPKKGSVVIRYKKSDGKGGEYDTLPDGNLAWWAEQNLLTVALAPQVLSTPGSVLLSVTLIADGTQLSIFPIRLAVEPIAAGKLAKSEDYFYITGLLPAPASGKVGQFLRIAAINDTGRIIAVEAADGVIPQKGIDYWTDSDKDAIIQDVLAALGTPVFGTVDEENNIILTGVLPDGTYTLKYEDSEGNLTEIGILAHSTEDTPDDTGSYRNLADPSSAEWETGYRLNSSGSLVEANITYVTNFIPCQPGDLIRIKGMHVGQCNGNYLRAQTFFYSEDKIAIARINPYNDSYVAADGWTQNDANALWTHTVGASTYTIVNGNVSDIRYCRFTGELYNGYTENDVIITVNQEIP